MRSILNSSRLVPIAPRKSLTRSLMPTCLIRLRQSIRRPAKQRNGCRTSLKDLQDEAGAAERAVIAYKQKNNIVDTGGRLINEQQIAEVNSALIQARAMTAEAKARLDRVQEITAAGDVDPAAQATATVADTLKSEVINKLRSQYLELRCESIDVDAEIWRQPPRRCKFTKSDARASPDLYLGNWNERQKVSKAITKLQKHAKNLFRNRSIRLSRNRKRPTKRRLRCAICRVPPRTIVHSTIAFSSAIWNRCSSKPSRCLRRELITGATRPLSKVRLSQC